MSKIRRVNNVGFLYLVSRSIPWAECDKGQEAEGATPICSFLEYMG